MKLEFFINFITCGATMFLKNLKVVSDFVPGYRKNLANKDVLILVVL